MSYRHGRLVIDTGDYFALSLWKMLFLQWRHQRNTSLPRFWIWSFTFEFSYLPLFSSLMILQLRDLYDWLNTCVRHVCRPKVFLSTHIVAYFSTFDLFFHFRFIISQEEAWTWTNRGFCLFRGQSYHLAECCASVALHFNNPFCRPQTFLCRALSRYQLGNIHGTLSDAKEIKQLDNNYARVRVTFLSADLVTWQQNFCVGPCFLLWFICLLLMFWAVIFMFLPQRVLPYICLTGMCRPKGYGFWADLVWKRV